MRAEGVRTSLDQLTKVAGAATPQRVGGIAAVVLANLAALLVLASGGGREGEVARPVVSQAIIMLPRPLAIEPEPVATPTVVAETRPRIVVPDLPAFQREPDEVTSAIAAPARPSPPLGLRSLIDKEPCQDPRERERRGDCPVDAPSDMADARADAIFEARRTELAEAFGPQCGQAHGCLPMPTRNLNGTRPVDPKGRMAGGAGSLGGIHDLIGRLPPPNWYHVDPGFGD